MDDTQVRERKLMKYGFGVILIVCGFVLIGLSYHDHLGSAVQVLQT